MRNDRLVAGLVYGGLSLVLVVCLLVLEGTPEQSRARLFKTGIDGLRWTRGDTSPILGALSALAACGLLIGAALRATPLWPRTLIQRGGRIALIALLLTSGFCWLYAARGIPRNDYIKAWDSFHYVLGPKYFEELGYFGLYDCVAAADLQTVNALKGRLVRDLRDYDRTLTLAQAAKRGECERRMSPARWKEFKDDYLFYARIIPDKLHHMARDRGYNGTPTHAFVAGKLLNLLPTNYRGLTLATLGDTLAMLAVFYALSIAFGWELTALIAILFFTLFSDRAQFIHGSFFRYHFVYLIGFALAALQRGRHALAGALIATAGMLNVFPVLFGLGVVFKGAWELARSRRLGSAYRRFVVGAALATVLCGGLGLAHGGGSDNYRDFMHNMEQHAGVLSVSRVGLKYDLLYRGETHHKRYDVDYTRIAAQQTRAHYLVALALLTLVLLVTVRRLDLVDATVLSGFAAFFYLFTTVSYYYGVYALLLLLLRRRLDRPSGWLLLALPFALNGAVVRFFETNGHSLGLTNNTGMSFAVTATLFAYQWARIGEAARGRADGVARGLGRAGLVVTAVAFALLCWHWSPPGKVAAAAPHAPSITFGGPDDPRSTARPSAADDPCAPTLHAAGDLTVELFRVRLVTRQAERDATGAGCAYLFGATGTLVDDLRPRFARARAAGHLIIVSADWNRGAMHSPGIRQTRTGRAILRAGAHALIGHSASSHMGVRLDRGRPLIDALPLNPKGEQVTLLLSPRGVQRVTLTPPAGRVNAMWRRSAREGTLLVVQDGQGHLDLVPR